MPAITQHAKTRMKSRAGVPTKAMKKMVRRAYERGIKYEDTDGELREFCKSKMIKKHGRRTSIRIHGGLVYVFDGIALLTAYQIPQEFRVAAERLQAKLKLQRKGGENDGTVGEAECDSVPITRDAGWQSPV